MARRSELMQLEIAVENRDALRRLEQTVSATNTAAGKINQSGQRMASGFDRISKSVNTLRNLLYLGGATALLVGGVRAIDRFVERRTELLNVSNAFEHLSGSVQQSTRMIDGMRRATRGQVSDFELMRQANNAILLGLPATANSMERLADVATKLGAAVGLDATQAFNSLVTGIGRQSRMMLDNLGIVVSAEEAYRKYAARLGVGVGVLTDYQRKLAFMEEALKQATDKAKGAGDVHVSAWTRAKIALGNYLDLLRQSTAELPGAIGRQGQFSSGGGRAGGGFGGGGSAARQLAQDEYELGRAVEFVNRKWGDRIAKINELIRKTPQVQQQQQLQNLITSHRAPFMAMGGELGFTRGAGFNAPLERDPLRLAAEENAAGINHLAGAYAELVREYERAIDANNRFWEGQQNLAASFEETTAAFNNHILSVELMKDKYSLLQSGLSSVTDSLWMMAVTGEVSLKKLAVAIAQQVFGHLAAVAIEEYTLGVAATAKAAELAAMAAIPLPGFQAFAPAAAAMSAAAGLHYAAAGKAAVGAGAALVVGAAFGGGGGGGSAGGGGGSRPSRSGALGPVATPGAGSGQIQEIRIFIEGTGFIQDTTEFARTIQREIERQSSRGGSS